MPDGMLSLADTAVGAVLLGAGALAWTGRRGSRVGPLMAMAGACWFLGSAFPGLVFLHRGPLVQLHLSYPIGRLHRWPARGVALAGYGAALYEGFVPAPWLTVGLSALVVAAALDVFARTSGPARRAGRSALAAALVFAAVLALGSANVLLEWGADRAVLLVYDTAVCLVVIWLTMDLRYGRWTEATVAELVTQLGRRTDIEGLQGQLARALGDPGLILGYRVPGRQAYCDETGRPLDIAQGAAGRVTTVVEDGGEPVAVLIHEPAVRSDPQLLHGAIAALRLTVANARMRAEVRARMAELATARRRIVEAADAQRRALEAELTTGAQTHLAQALRHLHALEAETDEEGRAVLPQVLAEVVAAQRELAQFAQGVRPPSLTAGGLGAALPLLADRAGLAVSVSVDVGRLPPPIEAATYFVCAEALTNVAKHAAATRATMEVVAEAGTVVVRVSDDGRGGADSNGSGLRGIADRVEALGGSITVGDGAAGGTLLTARIPAEGAASNEDHERGTSDEDRDRRRLDADPRRPGTPARGGRLRGGGDRRQHHHPDARA
ncbi:sensor histidine kinase [Streptomyces krungchingensis]|uniref:sensor histidine kinase n=1 Tax=Streptomyces krungchingensis TaxID=1565034 RepID=UPI003CF182D9